MLSIHTENLQKIKIIHPSETILKELIKIIIYLNNYKNNSSHICEKM